MITLYHGSKSLINLKSKFREVFLATNIEFTNNAEYGGKFGFKYAVDVELGKCFDSRNCNDIKILYANKMKLADPWLHVEDPISFKDDDDDFGGGFNDDLWEGYNPRLDYYKTAEAFCQSKTAKTSTWEAIEESAGVLDWIRANYDSCLILERGYINYIIFNKKCILNAKLLNPKPKE